MYAFMVHTNSDGAFATCQVFCTLCLPVICSNTKGQEVFEQFGWG